MVDSLDLIWLLNEVKIPAYFYFVAPPFMDSILKFTPWFKMAVLAPIFTSTFQPAERIQGIKKKYEEKRKVLWVKL